MLEAVEKAELDLPFDSRFLGDLVMQTAVETPGHALAGLEEYFIKRYNLAAVIVAGGRDWLRQTVGKKAWQILAIAEVQPSDTVGERVADLLGYRPGDNTLEMQLEYDSYSYSRTIPRSMHPGEHTTEKLIFRWALDKDSGIHEPQLVTNLTYLPLRGVQLEQNLYRRGISFLLNRGESRGLFDLAKDINQFCTITSSRQKEIKALPSFSGTYRVIFGNSE